MSEQLREYTDLALVSTWWKMYLVITMGWIVISAIGVSAIFIFTSCLITRHNYSNVFSTKTNIANRWLRPKIWYLHCKRTGETMVLNSSKWFRGMPTIWSCYIDITHMVQFPQVDQPSWPGTPLCFCAMVYVWGLVPVDGIVGYTAFTCTWLPCGLLEGHVLCKMSNRGNAINGSETVKLGRLCLCIWEGGYASFQMEAPQREKVLPSRVIHIAMA